MGERMVRNGLANRAVVHLVLAVAIAGTQIVAITQITDLSAGHRSNILLIIADDLGTDKVGIYGRGEEATRPRTPNIDDLATRGVTFLNAYANPMCSTTRAAILSGQYAFRTGVGDIIRREDDFALPLYPEQVPIPIMLARGGAGYDCAQLGKWHLGTRTVGGPKNPLLHGFAYTAGSQRNLQGNYFCWQKQINGALFRTDVYATTDTTNDAIKHANSMRPPWFLWVAYNAPHPPFHVPPAHLLDRDVLRNDRVLQYVAMVEALDTEIGRLLDSIAADILENTTVIFIGDNGTPREVLRAPYNRDPTKGSVYEGGINVPLIVAGPVVPATSRGRFSEALVNCTDIYATVADIAGVDLNQTLPPEMPLDSVSILPSLRDPDNPRSLRKYVYNERFFPNGFVERTLDKQALRDDRWKIMRLRISGLERFFDLQAAEPGTDGDDLCPCPGNLSGEALLAYERLAGELDAIRSP